VSVRTPRRSARQTGAAEPGSTLRRNFRLGVLNGAIYQGGEGFIDSGTVIPVFLSQLTSSNALIGFSTALSDMGWLLPQLFVAPWASRYPRQMWLYRRAALVRGGAIALLAALIWPLGDHPAALLAVFLVCYSIYSFGAGFGGVAFMEVVARTVPRERLGSFWALRMFWGGTLAACAGLVVRQVLRLEDPGLKYTILFGLGAVICSTGYSLFAGIREPAAPVTPTAETPLALLREGFGLLHGDATFRRLLMSRAVLSIWFTVSPFMVLFAVRDLAGGPRAAGTFLMSRVVGYVLANLAWHPISQRYGNRALMRIATLATSVLALAASGVAFVSPWSRGWITAGAAVTALELIAFLGGGAHSALLIGYSSLVIELAPAGGRQSFVSLVNTFLGPTMLLPVLGGALVDAVNAPVLFALFGLVGFLGFRAATKLPRTRPTPEAAIGPRAAAELVTGDEP